MLTNATTPLDTFDLPRETKIRAVMALIRLDALDLLPVLFAPIGPGHLKGLGWIGQTRAVDGRFR